MSRDETRRWYPITIFEWCLLTIILTITVLLLHPIFQNRRSEVEQYETKSRAFIWLEAADTYEKQIGKPLETVEQLKQFVFSDNSDFCNVPDLNSDGWGTPFWGTPFRLSIKGRSDDGRVLEVRSAGGNTTFDETDRKWNMSLRESPTSGVVRASDSLNE